MWQAWRRKNEVVDDGDAAVLVVADRLVDETRRARPPLPTMMMMMIDLQMNHVMRRLSLLELLRLQ